MSEITPTPRQLEAFLGLALDGPIHMVNLLKYRERADYRTEIAEDADCSGAEAYARYGRNTLTTLAAVGGRIVWSGSPAPALIGDGPDWDQVVIVEYPSADAFRKMLAMPDYLAGQVHRAAGLERTLVLPCPVGPAT